MKNSVEVKKWCGSVPTRVGVIEGAWHLEYGIAWAEAAGPQPPPKIPEKAIKIEAGWRVCTSI
jgi:hypothetical protein